MKEAIAQSFLINIIIIFLVVLMLLLFGSINYSKAYKVKNRIINIIEKYGEYDPSKDNIKNEIQENLRNAGYQTTSDAAHCDNLKIESKGGTTTILYPTEAEKRQLHYDYCIFKLDGSIEGSNYYQVITFMKFDIPILGGFLQFPVRGETKVFYDNIK